jgi:hypothetical protein
MGLGRRIGAGAFVAGSGIARSGGGSGRLLAGATAVCVITAVNATPGLGVTAGVARTGNSVHLIAPSRLKVAHRYDFTVYGHAAGHDVVFGFLVPGGCPATYNGAIHRGYRNGFQNVGPGKYRTSGFVKPLKPDVQYLCVYLYGLSQSIDTVPLAHAGKKLTYY